ncbi:MAG: HAMP domain-containing sensor histidine kinase [Elusimicrobiales bacterium]|nr:HAMP domain-containing sensor histidine kinase [Elusimicrobiales bacterium]
MSIRTKLILFILTLLTAISAVTAFLFQHNEWSSISANSQRKNLQILLSMSEVCKEMYRTPDKSSAYKYFKEFLKAPEIIKVSCSGPDGRVFMEDRYYSPYPPPFRYYFKNFSPPNTGTWETSSDNGVDILKASFSARGRTGEITARVDFSTQLIYQEMDSSLRQSSANFFIILSIAFAIGCAGTLIITRVIAGPIQTIEEAARIIGSGQLDHRVPIASKDELGGLAAEFNKMADKLKEYDEMKRDFVSSITHDLRSPVTGIELCSDIILKLAEKRESARIPEQVFSINEHSQRLKRFIDSMLEVSRIESGKLTLDLKPMNLENLVDRAVRAFKTYAAQKGLKLEFIVAGEIPDVRGDQDRLYQVLANVIGNAVKFTDSGSVSVFIETLPGWQKVRVCDTGAPIPPHELKNIFSKFYRISSGRREYPSARQGTGLGLFIAKYLIELHGGRIEAESGAGGNTFSIFLPS